MSLVRGREPPRRAVPRLHELSEQHRMVAASSAVMLSGGLRVLERSHTLCPNPKCHHYGLFPRPLSLHFSSFAPSRPLTNRLSHLLLIPLFTPLSWAARWMARCHTRSSAHWEVPSPLFPGLPLGAMAVH